MQYCSSTIFEFLFRLHAHTRKTHRESGSICIPGLMSPAMAAVPRARPRSVRVQFTHYVSSSVLTRWSLLKVVMTRGDACRLQGSLRMLLGREIFGDLWQLYQQEARGPVSLSVRTGRVSLCICRVSAGMKRNAQDSRSARLLGCLFQSAL